MQERLNERSIRPNAILLSALKGLLIFEKLLESPKTIEQIQNYLSTFSLFKSKASADSIRVYLNSLKKAGCQIERKLTKEKRRQYCYFIPTSPFSIHVSELQTQHFFNIYDSIMYNEDFETFLNVDALAKTINSYLNCTNFHNAFEKHSLIKNFDIELLKELNQCCINKNLITVLYNSPQSGIKEIPIIAQQMKFENYKLYLQGFGKEYNQEALFLVDRIVKINNIVQSTETDFPIADDIEILLELYDSDISLNDNEEILSQNENIRYVKHKTNNKILSTQRFLQLGASCKIIEPQDYKNHFVSTLKNMKEIYAHD